MTHNVVILSNIVTALERSITGASEARQATDYVVVNAECTMQLRQDAQGQVRFTPARGALDGGLVYDRLAMAGELAWRWNQRLTAQQRADGCEVVAMPRAEAAAKVIDHARALFNAIHAPDAPPFGPHAA